MNKITLAALVVLILGCEVLINGQNKPVTNHAGVPFPTIQYQPTMFNADEHTTDKVSKNFYRGHVEIRTPGIIVRADEATHDVTTGQVELRGNVSATMVPVKPIWPDAQQ
jgi:lipopolysaccharide assembly outer membrane protein LptD (OstA)